MSIVLGGLLVGLFYGLSAALFAALRRGGMSVIRHYTLRAMIYFFGYGPWDYARFLDYAVDELQFMQRVGGGYIFIHRMLLEHFAALEDGEVPEKEQEVSAPVV